MIKILVADDHPVVREGIKQIVEGTSDMTVGGEALNGQEVLNKVMDEDWDVVLLDISMPGRSGLDILKQLRIHRPELPVLILSMHSEDQYAVRALRAGASGYMTKESAPDQLEAAIRKVSMGGKFVSQALAEKLAFDLQAGVERPLHENLSDREFDVMRLIASGKKVSEIAEELSLSVKTISTYRRRILEKMKMNSNAQLTYYAIRNHLIE